MRLSPHIRDDMITCGSEPAREEAGTSRLDVA